MAVPPIRQEPSPIGGGTSSTAGATNNHRNRQVGARHPQAHHPQAQPDAAPLSGQAVLMRLNTRALIMFSEGDEDDALQVLHHGIGLARRALQRGLRPTAVPRRRPRMNLTTLSLEEIVWPEHQGDTENDNTDGDGDGDGNNDRSSMENRLRSSCFDFYPFIFLMEEDEDEDEDEDDNDPENAQQEEEARPCLSLAHVCVLLTYNLGVLHHKLGLVRHANNPLAECFAKARSYYAAALQVWNRVANQEETLSLYATEMSPARIPLALYNNMGHLAAIWGDDSDMLACRVGLEQALVTATTVHRRRGRGGNIRPNPLSHNNDNNNSAVEMSVAEDPSESNHHLSEEEDHDVAMTITEEPGALELQDRQFFHSSLERARNHQSQNAPAA